jgi:hypothetical protein
LSRVRLEPSTFWSSVNCLIHWPMKLRWKT